MTPCDRLRHALASGDQTLLADPSLRAHLAVCPTCASALAADQALRRALAALSRPPLSPALERRLRAVPEGASSRAEPSAGRQTAPPATGDASRDHGAPRRATRFVARGSGRRERAVAVLLLAACLAGLAFALGRLRPAPADLDATPPAPPTAPTRLPGDASPTPADPTPWPTPRPPLPPLPRIPDEGLALPEGAMVVVADEAGLLLFEGVEKGRRLVENGWEEDLRAVGAKISPDGQWVAFSAQRPLATEVGGVWVVGSAGGAPRRVIDATNLAEKMPAQRTPATSWRTTLRSVDWTPDSKALLFDTYEADLEAGMGSADNDDLWLQPVDGGEAQRLLPAGQGGDFSFSPDGRNIALVRRVTDGGSGYDSIALASAKGGMSRELLRLAPMGTDSSWRPLPRPLWSPDSTSLFLFLTKASPGRNGYADMHAPAPLIQLMLDGSYREVAPASRSNVMNGFNMPLSPDGKTVALYHPLDPAVVPKAVAPSQQSSQAASAYPSDDSTPYPPPVVEPVQPDQEALMLATVGERAAVAYDLVMMGITHQLCWSPSGLRFAYDVVHPKWRIGTRNEAPRELDLSVAACHWLSDNLLLVREAKGLRLLDMDGGERLLWESRDKESFTFAVHLVLPPAAQAEQPVEFSPTPTASATARLFASPPILTAAHIGSIGFVGDGAWAQVMAWDEEDLPVEEPPPVGRLGDWPKGRLVALDLAGGGACHLAEAAGPPVPERRDEAFARTAWLAEHGGPQVLAAGKVGEREGLHGWSDPCDPPTHIPLPDGALASAVLGANPRGTHALVASADRYWLLDRAEDGSWSRARAIPGLIPVDWALARWSPDGRWLALMAAAAQVRPGLKATPPDIDNSPHELVLVDGALAGGSGDIQPAWRLPLRLRTGMGSTLLTHVDWLSDEVLLLASSSLPDSVLKTDGRRQNVADLIGLDDLAAKNDLEVTGQPSADGKAFHLLVYQGADDLDRLLYHSEDGSVESLGRLWRARMTWDDRLIGQSDLDDEKATLIARPLDPPGGQPQESPLPCGQDIAETLSGAAFPWRHAVNVPRYVGLRAGGRIALRDTESCALTDLVAIEGVDRVQQARLSPDGRKLIVVGGSGILEDLGLYVVDLQQVADGSVAEAPPIGGAEPGPYTNPTAVLSGDDGSLAYAPTAWESEPSSPDGAPEPWLRSRQVPQCWLRLHGDVFTGPPTNLLELGRYRVYLGDDSGLGAFYSLEPTVQVPGEQQPQPARLLRSRFTPRSWAACDQAVRRLIEELP